LFFGAARIYCPLMDEWRVILNGPESASFNMAADAVLFERAEDCSSPPVLRLYAWDKPSITIGFHQTLERALDVQKLDHTPVVRRVTGGRALLHDDGELTYAVAGDFRRHPVLGDTLATSYHVIAEAIIRFYRSLGWPAVMARRDDPILLSGSAGVQKGCFASVSRFEITASGQKLAASSQRRGRSTLIQHGAIRTAHPSRHPAIANFPDKEVGAAFQALAGSRRDLEKAFIRACEETFRASAVFVPFSGEELAAIEARMIAYKNIAAGNDLIKQSSGANSPKYGTDGGSKGQKTS
jgi:lipoate-protein ligase A